MNPYAKVFVNDLACLSAGVNGIAAYAALVVAHARAGVESHAAVFGDGSPMSAEDLAHLVGCAHQIDAIADGLAQLVRHRRVEVVDGAYAIVGWGRSQRSPAAAKQAAYRDRQRTLVTGHVTRDLLPDPDPDPDHNGVGGPPPEALAGAKRKRKPKREIPTPDLRAAVVLSEIDAARRRLGLRALSQSERDDRHVVALLDDGVTVDDLLLVVRLREAEGMGNPVSASYLDARAPFSKPHAGKPGGWSASRRMLDAHALRSAAPRHSGETPESMERRLHVDAFEDDGDAD